MTVPDIVPNGYSFAGVADRVGEFLDLKAWTSPNGLAAEDLSGLRLPFEWDDVTGVEVSQPDLSHGELVGAAVTHKFASYPVPGAYVGAGVLAEVGVHPQHRRRGIMSALVAHHLAECRRRGLLLSVLGASEATVYGRFGYGVAAESLLTSLPARTELVDIPGAAEHSVTIESAHRDRHGEMVRRVHHQAGDMPLGSRGLNRPGWLSRETEAMEAAFWDDSPIVRSGWEPLRIAVVRRDGEPRGYARFRRSTRWNRMRPEGSVLVGEAIAVDMPSARALWGVLLELDLMTEIEPAPLVSDDHLFGMLVDSRAVDIVPKDSIWVRLVDVPQALTARSYSTDIDAVIEVADHAIPANSGRWRLKAAGFGTASCDRTLDDPIATFDAAALGAIYLGTTSVATLARQNRISIVDHSRAGELAAAFSWPVPAGASWSI